MRTLCKAKYVQIVAEYISYSIGIVGDGVMSFWNGLCALFAFFFLAL